MRNSDPSAPKVSTWPRQGYYNSRTVMGCSIHRGGGGPVGGEVPPRQLPEHLKAPAQWLQADVQVVMLPAERAVWTLLSPRSWHALKTGGKLAPRAAQDAGGNEREGAHFATGDAYVLGTWPSCHRGQVVVLDRAKLTDVVDLTTPEALQREEHRAAAYTSCEPLASMVAQYGWPEAAARGRMIICLGDIEEGMVLASTRAAEIGWGSRRSLDDVRSHLTLESIQRLAKVATEATERLCERLHRQDPAEPLWPGYPRYVIATDASVAEGTGATAAGIRAYFARHPVETPAPPDCPDAQLQGLCARIRAGLEPGGDPYVPVWTYHTPEGRGPDRWEPEILYGTLGPNSWVRVERREFVWTGRRPQPATMETAVAGLSAGRPYRAGLPVDDDHGTNSLKFKSAGGRLELSTTLVLFLDATHVTRHPGRTTTRAPRDAHPVQAMETVGAAVRVFREALGKTEWEHWISTLPWTGRLEDAKTRG